MNSHVCGFGPLKPHVDNPKTNQSTLLVTDLGTNIVTCPNQIAQQ